MTNVDTIVDALCRLSEWQTGMKKRDPEVHIGWAAAAMIEGQANRIAALERDFHKQCELTARTMTRVADAEGEAAMLSILLERREKALMQVDKMCDAPFGLLVIQEFVRAALNGEKQ